MQTNYQFYIQNKTSTHEDPAFEPRCPKFKLAAMKKN